MPVSLCVCVTASRCLFVRLITILLGYVFVLIEFDFPSRVVTHSIRSFYLVLCRLRCVSIEILKYTYFPFLLATRTHISLNNTTQRTITVAVEAAAATTTTVAAAVSAANRLLST